MGAVLYRTGRMNGSELGGLYKSMPKTTVLCIVGAASISAFPLFSGFVSKSMVMSAVLSEDYPLVWLALLFASAGVFHHAGIKIPFFAFFAHDSGLRAQEAPGNMLLAMTLAAVICVTIGSYPALLYQHLPFPVNYSAYDYSHVVAQLQLLFFSALAFIWLRRRGLYPPELKSVNLDVDWFFRKPVLQSVQAVLGRAGAMAAMTQAKVVSILRSVLVVIQSWLGPRSVVALPWSTASMVFVVALLLTATLLFMYSR